MTLLLPHSIALKNFLSQQSHRPVLVPTMGALHEGHGALIDRALACQRPIIISIFVNPRQFAPHEDYDNYPRLLEQDRIFVAKRTQGSQYPVAIFAPTAQDIYPENFATSLSLAGPAQIGLEDRYRPGFFDGVGIVVLRLFMLTMAEFACFGEKDYQQLQVIKSLVSDLALPVTILSVPTMREESGLALSSRNIRLSPSARQMTAPYLYKRLQILRTDICKQPAQWQALCRQAGTDLQANGFGKIDYLHVRDSNHLQPVADIDTDRQYRLLVALYLENVRLLDNIPI